MNSKSLNLTIFFTICFGTLYAQQSINGAGSNATGSNGSVSYSVGQVDYVSNNSVTGSENQGVQQPYEFFTMSIGNNSNPGFSASLFPNPSTAYVNLKIDQQELSNLSFLLYDADGKLLLLQSITATESIIPMETLAAGIYFLKLSQNQTEIKTFKIIKK